MAYEKSKISTVPYFYDKQLRRYIQQFIRIFGGFQIAVHTNSEGDLVYQTVPVRYGEVNRMAAHIVKENSENTMNSTPFISCYVTGLETAPQSRTYSQFEETVPVYEKKYNEVTGSYENEVGNVYSIKRHQPVPYTLTMQVDLWTSNTEQKLQILEQILVLFNPTLNIHTSDNPLDWSSLSYVELISSTWSMRTIPSGIDDIIDISTLTFQLPILINPPAKVLKNTVIHTIIDNIEDVTSSDLDSIRAGGSYSPLFTSYKIITLDNYKMKFLVDNAGNATAQLLNRDTSATDNNAQILNWVSIFKPYGEFRDSISQIRLKQTTDPSNTADDIIGNIVVNTGNSNLLNITLDVDTLPANTQGIVDAVINPQANFPGDGTLTAAADNDRYLLTSDVAGGSGWGGIIATKHDIIQYNGSNWSVVFDASLNGTTVQHITNTTTGDKLKWNGSEWVNAFEGTYNPGFWRIYM